MQCSVLFQVKPNWRTQHRSGDKIDFLRHCSPGSPDWTRLGNQRQQELSWRVRPTIWEALAAGTHEMSCPNLDSKPAPHCSKMKEWCHTLQMSPVHRGRVQGEGGEGCLHRLERVSFYLMHQSTSAKRESGWFFPVSVIGQISLLNPESQDLRYFDPKNFPFKNRSGTLKYKEQYDSVYSLLPNICHFIMMMARSISAPNKKNIWVNVIKS